MFYLAFSLREDLINIHREVFTLPAMAHYTLENHNLELDVLAPVDYP